MGENGFDIYMVYVGLYIHSLCFTIEIQLNQCANLTFFFVFTINPNMCSNTKCNMLYVTCEIQKFKPYNNCNLNKRKRISYEIQFDWNVFACYRCVFFWYLSFSTLFQWNWISVVRINGIDMTAMWYVAHLVHLITNILDLH